jgi:16S rRNA (uracil1498-N3)-methyltransferase
MAPSKISSTLPRLFVSHPLEGGAMLSLSREQSHYLAHVMRCRKGDALRLFNGTEGEWRGEIHAIGRHQVDIMLTEQLRAQQTEPDIWLVFAPLKGDRLHMLIEKSTELGVTALLPVITQHTVHARFNHDKLARYTEEAAEQTERLTVPPVHMVQPLMELLESWPVERRIIFCDESGGGRPIKEALMELPAGSYALLTGPEGGFSKAELEYLHQLPYVIPVGLGPRILRAETASIAALTCAQLFLGDWSQPPRFTVTS